MENKKIRKLVIQFCPETGVYHAEWLYDSRNQDSDFFETRDYEKLLGRLGRENFSTFKMTSLTVNPPELRKDEERMNKLAEIIGFVPLAV